MAKVRVPIANAPGKVAIVDLDPPGRAVLGQNVYIVLPDGTKALLDQNDILNGTPVAAPQVVITPTPSTTSSTTAAQKSTQTSSAKTVGKAYSMISRQTQTRLGIGHGTSSGVPSGPAGNDLGGFYPNPTVPNLPRNLGTTTNTGNTYTAGTAPAGGYVSGVLYIAKFNAANTGAATLDGHSVYKNGAALTGAEIAANASIALTYNGTQFDMTGDGGAASGGGSGSDPIFRIGLAGGGL
jgi:hypothetical protein